jgi:hypothetical protein
MTDAALVEAAKLLVLLQLVSIGITDPSSVRYRLGEGGNDQSFESVSESIAGLEGIITCIPRLTSGVVILDCSKVTSDPKIRSQKFYRESFEKWVRAASPGVLPSSLVEVRIDPIIRRLPFETVTAFFSRFDLSDTGFGQDSLTEEQMQEGVVFAITITPFHGAVPRVFKVAR